MWFIFSWSAYNGATYYIEVFGKRFEKELARLRQEINELQLRLDKQEQDRELESDGVSKNQDLPVMQPHSGETENKEKIEN